MSKPINVFEDKKQLNKYLKWWQDKLFLNDWIIKVSLCSPDEFINENMMGENSFDMVNKCSIIRILKPEYYGKRIMIYCAEKVLVHELLHCKYNWVANDMSYEGKYTDVSEHSLLEQMAKSLIMTKYNVDLDYFINH